MGLPRFNYILQLGRVTTPAERDEITRDLHRVLGVGRHLAFAHLAEGAATAVGRLTDEVGAVAQVAGLPILEADLVEGTAVEAVLLAGSTIDRLVRAADRSTARVLKYRFQQIRAAFGGIDPVFGESLGFRWLKPTRKS